MHRLLALAVTTAALGALPSLAAAQEAAGDRVNTVIIYGDDPCPPSASGEIVVCARMDEGERYRIPEALRQSNSPANESWASRVRSFETIGDFGPLSCSSIGAGSELGCTAKMIEAAYAEKAQGSNGRFNQLIAAAREERLSTIDQEAAETQARVEELERSVDERIRREQAAGGEVSSSAAPAMASPAAQPVDTSRLSRPPGE
jgi:hypothetical protein